MALKKFEDAYFNPNTGKIEHKDRVEEFKTGWDTAKTISEFISSLGFVTIVVILFTSIIGLTRWPLLGWSCLCEFIIILVAGVIENAQTEAVKRFVDPQLAQSIACQKVAEILKQKFDFENPLVSALIKIAPQLSVAEAKSVIETVKKEFKQ